MAGYSKPRIDLKNQKFTYLTVLDWVKINNLNKNSKSQKGGWLCQCKCGNQIIVRSNSLITGRTKSCGCYSIEQKLQRKKKNKFNLSGIYGIGYTVNSNKEFYFDLEDYDKIKQYTWSEKNGYVKTTKYNKEILLHRLILGLSPQDLLIVDHIGHNTLDNRKINLRITNHNGNLKNKSLSKNNTSGVTGVSWEEKSNKWHSYIWNNGKCIHIGRFTKFDDAVKARKQAEEKYFGKYSYDNSMKYYELEG